MKLRIFFLVAVMTMIIISSITILAQDVVSNPKQTDFTVQRIDSIHRLTNLYRIDQQLYRSEQPDAGEMEALEKLGIRTILNLRNAANDNDEAKNTRLILVHIPMNPWTLSYSDLVNAIKEIEMSPKPVLVHCKHGSDRTGAVVAAYRMTQGMNKKQAIFEFRESRYGYHKGWFPGILSLLEAIDVEKLKTDVKTN